MTPEKHDAEVNLSAGAQSSSSITAASPETGLFFGIQVSLGWYSFISCGRMGH